VACRVLLAPATAGYRLAVMGREAVWSSGLMRRLHLPQAVVSVGNLTVGGTGKTPLVEWIARRFSERGRRVAIVSRGHGGRRVEATEIVSDGRALLVGAARAGDEPVLLARRLTGVPVVVGRDRAAAALTAVERFGTEILLLDDGFQQRRLHTDVNVVCLDARCPWGGGLLPAGTLREPRRGLARAHLLVLTRADQVSDLAPTAAEIRRVVGAAPMVSAWLEAEDLLDVGADRRYGLDALAGRTVLAFAGIAEPEGLRRLLEHGGADVRGLVAFPDHHVYDPGDLRGLEGRARAAGADLLVTTEKDAVRLPGPLGLPLWALSVRVRLGEGAEGWAAELDRRVERALQRLR
jgi:tetraacyldisaccharide 4'-kinase